LRPLADGFRLLLAFLLATSSLAAPAMADTGYGGTDPSPAIASINLPWQALGLPRTISLNAPNSNQDFLVPAPVGLNVARLRGTLHAPVNLSAGYLEISDQNGTFLAAINLPPVAANQAVTPFDVDISAARPREAAVGLSFTVRQVNSAGQICGPMQQLLITDLSVDYVGAEPPATTVGTFFPPVLQRMTIYAPLDADAAEKQAVLALTSAVVRLYRPQPVAVTVINQPRGVAPPPAPQLVRNVVVERGPAGLSLVNPGTPDAYLRLSGRGDELTAQTSLVANRLQALVQVDASRVDQPGATPLPTGDNLTFKQLDMKGRADVIRTGNLYVGTDLAALGQGRVNGVQVHLLANYTPVANRDEATIMVRTNGDVVYSHTLDDTGHLDATFELPRQSLTQRVGLDMAITYTPHQECGPMIAPLSFQVDPQSSLTIKRGGSAPGGFSSVPSEFSPTFYAAFDGTSPDQLGYAARTVAAISRLTTAALTPRVVDVKAAAEASGAALIVANSATLRQTSLNPPLSGSQSEINVDLPSQLHFDANHGLGSIQAFADQARNRTVVLITTTDSWTMVNPLFDYIDGLDGGWSQLTGDTLAAGAAGIPIDVAIHSQDSTTTPHTGWSHRLQIIGGLVLAALVLGAGAFWWRRRSRDSQSV